MYLNMEHKLIPCGISSIRRAERAVFPPVLPVLTHFHDSHDKYSETKPKLAKIVTTPHFNTH